MAETEDQLAALRREIDAVDTKLHDLLMQRTELAVRVGEVKAKAQPIGRSPRDGAKFVRPAREAQILFFLYFCMTGMHALHMVIGEGLLLTILVMAWRGRFGAHWNTPVDMVGLYWHFVDIVWIFLFPLLYLIGKSSL